MIESRFFLTSATKVSIVPLLNPLSKPLISALSAIVCDKLHHGSEKPFAGRAKLLPVASQSAVAYQCL